jgi:hypothetical protein
MRHPKNHRPFPLLLVAAALGLAALGPNVAQAGSTVTGMRDRDMRPDRPQPPQVDEETMRKAQEEMRATRLLLLTQALGLGESAAIKLSTKLRPIDEEEEALHRKRHEIVRDLDKQLSKKKPRERALKSSIAKMEEIHRKLKALDQKRRAVFKSVLTVRQQAELILIAPRIEHRLRRMAEQARRGGPPGPPGPPRPPRPGQHRPGRPPHPPGPPPGGPPPPAPPPAG